MRAAAGRVTGFPPLFPAPHGLAHRGLAGREQMACAVDVHANGEGKIPMKATDKPIANPVVVLREEFDDWAVLFNPDTADALGTNPVGVAVWKRMDGRRTVGEIVADIQDGFDGAPESISKEIDAFVNALSNLGFAGLELDRKAADA